MMNTGSTTHDQYAQQGTYQAVHQEASQPATVKKPSIHSGENNPLAKLTEAQVLEARSLYKPYCRKLGAHALARKYGVAYQTMQNAISGARWSYLN